MRILRAEFAKVYAKKGIWLLLILLILLNGFLLVRNESVSHPMVTAEEYVAQFSYMKGMTSDERAAYLAAREEDLKWIMQLTAVSEDQAGAFLMQNDLAGSLTPEQLSRYQNMIEEGSYLQFTRGPGFEYELNRTYYQQQQALAGYRTSIEEIQEKAASMTKISIFADEGSFSFRNIQKTAEDFKSFQNLTLPFDQSLGINMSTGFIGTDIAILFLVFMVCTSLITQEKEKGLFSLVRSACQGRAPVIASKIGVLAVSCGMFTGLLFGSNVLIASWIYGLGDLSRPIQSVDTCMGLALPVNVWQYLLLLFLMKWLLFFLFALILLLFSLVIRSPVLICAGIIGVIGVEYAAYALISSTSSLSFFKYVNLVYFTFQPEFYRTYLNVDFFSVPVNLFTLFFVVCVILMACLIAGNMLLFCRGKNKASKGAALFASRRKKRHVQVHLTSHELYKALIANKVLFLLLAFLGFQLYGATQAKSMLTTDDLYYKSYVQVLKGPVTEASLSFIEKEQEKFTHIDEQTRELGEQFQSGSLSQSKYEEELIRLSAQTKSRKVFEQDILGQLRYMEEYKETQGRELWFVDDFGFRQLTAEQSVGTDQYNAFLLVLMLIVGLSATFSSEYSSSMARLITTCPKGRGATVTYKLCISFLIVLFVFLTVYLPELINIVRLYGMDGLDAPVQSMQHLQQFPLAVSIRGYLVLLYVTRLLAAMGVAGMILLFSLVVKDSLKAMLLSFGLFAAPLACSMLGIHWLDSITCNILLTGNQLLQGAVSNRMMANVLMVVYPIIAVSMAIFSGVWIYQKFGKDI